MEGSPAATAPQLAQRKFPFLLVVPGGDKRIDPFSLARPKILETQTFQTTYVA